jgi:hypothetical protein
MTNPRAESGEANLDCILVLTITLLAVGSALLYGGIAWIIPEPRTTCGGIVLKEGEVRAVDADSEVISTRSA